MLRQSPILTPFMVQEVAKVVIDVASQQIINSYYPPSETTHYRDGGALHLFVHKIHDHCSAEKFAVNIKAVQHKKHDRMCLMGFKNLPNSLLKSDYEFNRILFTTDFGT